jgi:hypothetical protein
MKRRSGCSFGWHAVGSEEDRAMEPTWRRSDFLSPMGIEESCSPRDSWGAPTLVAPGWRRPRIHGEDFFVLQLSAANWGFKSVSKTRKRKGRDPHEARRPR